MIRGIDKFILIDNQLILKSGNKLTCGDLELVLNSGDSVFIQANIIYKMDENMVVFINHKTLQYIDSPILAASFNSISNSEYLVGYTSNKKSNISYYKNNEISWTKKFDDITVYLIFEEIILIKYLFLEHKIVAVSKTDGKTLWEFSVKELGKYSDWEGEHEGKIDGKIFEYQGVLIMRITENQLIGIDNKTGKLLWKIQYPPIVFFYGKHNDEFYVMHESFCLLNPLTGKETPRFPFLSVFEKEKVENYCVQLFSDKYMYTIGRWDLNILQWDKQTGEIVWKQELHPKKRKGRHGVTLKGDVLEPVQFANGKLYVLDSTKVLHIFETE